MGLQRRDVGEAAARGSLDVPAGDEGGAFSTAFCRCGWGACRSAMEVPSETISEASFGPGLGHAGRAGANPSALPGVYPGSTPADLRFWVLGVVLFDGGGGFVGDDEGFSREVLI